MKANIKQKKIVETTIEADGLTVLISADGFGFNVRVTALLKKAHKRARGVAGVLQSIPDIMWSRGDATSSTTQYGGKFKPLYLEHIVAAVEGK